jgi:CHAD domain-containing protein
MAHRLKRRESVPKAVRRLGRERIAHALKCMKARDDQPEGIHCARKDIKEARAVVQLVRPVISKKVFRRVTEPLREAAAYLAPLRDAYVKTQTLRHLTPLCKRRVAPGALRQARVELHRACVEQTNRFARKRTSLAVQRRLRHGSNLLERLYVCRKGWKALRPGVTHAYGKGRRAYQTALVNPSSENFHSWRKRTKDLCHHARLLQRMKPEQMEAMVSELNTLGEYLGGDHDLAVLQQDLPTLLVGPGHAQAREVFTRLIERRQRQFRVAALALGAKCFAEKPSTFCDRLAGYWRSWRHEN